MFWLESTAGRSQNDGMGNPPSPSSEKRTDSVVRRPPEHYLVLGTALIALAVMLVLAFMIEPDERGFGTHEQLGLPSCKTMEWFGIPCPGCGVTTSLAHAVRGEFATSFSTQPLGIPVAIVIPLIAFWAVLNHLRGGDLQKAVYGLSAVRWVAWVVVIVLVVWVLQVRRFLG